MIIKKASFKNLHGHITKALEFSRGVNILIGVNGSGKTTILNAMAWTLSPESIQGGLSAAYLLSTLDFEEIRITFTLPGICKNQQVAAKRTTTAVVITAKDVNGELQIPVNPQVYRPRFMNPQMQEEAANIVASHLSGQRSNPVLEYLISLPGPLYLPLDRRWPETEEPRYRHPRGRRRISLGHLPISEVLDYSETAYRREQSETDQLNYGLRNKLLGLLFEAPESSRLAHRLEVLPIQELKNHRQRIVSTLAGLGLNDAESDTKEFFDALEKIVQKLEGHDLSNIGPDDPLHSTWVNWIIDGSPLAERIERLVPLIEEYESNRLSTTKPSRSFLDSVNGFLSDSGKRILFSEPEGLRVQLPNGQNASAADLSSGELQLLILFTFLYFGFGQQEEFTIIIDEPELSLHLAWQGRYLEAITQANPNAQFIVATHSPEIAAPFEDREIDISPQTS